MATDNNNRSDRGLAPPTSSAAYPSIPSEDFPSHPPLQYEDSQRFLNCAFSIDFDSSDHPADRMFDEPMTTPNVSNSRIRSPEELQRRAIDFPPLRGTGSSGGKRKRQDLSRTNTPQAEDGALDLTDEEQKKPQCKGVKAKSSVETRWNGSEVGKHEAFTQDGSVKIRDFSIGPEDLEDGVSCEEQSLNTQSGDESGFDDDASVGSVIVVAQKRTCSTAFTS